jgi:membrane protein
MMTEKLAGYLASLSVFIALVGRKVTTKKVKYPAIAIAYYGFMAVVPLFLFVIAFVGTILEDDILESVDDFTPQYLTPEARQLIIEAVITASGRTGAIAFAICILAWSSANVVVAFLEAFDRIENTVDRPLRSQIHNGALVFSVLGLAALATLITSVVATLLSIVPLGPLSPATTVFYPFFLFGLLTLVFIPLYYVPSAIIETPLRAVPGAIVAASGWVLLQTVVQFYAMNAGQYALYGVLSGIIVVLTAFYAAGFFLILGAVVNETYSRTNLS